jgi:electron transport complex protein RnfG
MNKKESFAAPVVVLSAICLVVSLALAFTYKIANPIIIRNTEAVAVAARQEILPAADSFTKVEDAEMQGSEDGKAAVQEVYAADNGSGYVMTVETTSFGGALTMMVGIDGEGAITGVKVTEHADTPGVGTKDQDPEYLAQYISKNALSSEDVKKEAGFNFITGASVSGTAIHKGVYAALAQYAALGGAK